MDDNIMDKLRGLLDNPDALNSLSQMFSGSQQQESESQAPAPVQQQQTSSSGSSDNMAQIDMMMKIKSAMDSMSNTNDPRINLLSALRPYMRNKRGKQMDKAMKMLQMTKMTSLFKDMK